MLRMTCGEARHARTHPARGDRGLLQKWLKWPRKLRYVNIGNIVEICPDKHTNVENAVDNVKNFR